MPDDHRCGDAGGKTAAGIACRRVTESGRRCPQHPSGRPVVLGDGSRCNLLEGAGQISGEDGAYAVDAIGFALRAGLADVSAEVAAKYFPAVELLPHEERPEPGELLEGEPVFCWLRQADAAELIGLTGRHLQNLEAKGLPNAGRRASKRYPLPHLLLWHDQYAQEVQRNGSCQHLSFRVAWARHRLHLAEMIE